MILSFGGGKPFIHPMTLGSESCDESGVVCAPAGLPEPRLRRMPKETARDLEFKNGIEEAFFLNWSGIAPCNSESEEGSILLQHSSLAPEPPIERLFRTHNMTTS